MGIMTFGSLSEAGDGQERSKLSTQMSVEI